MWDRRLVAAGAGLALVLVLGLSLFVLAPRLASGALQDLVSRELGRSLSVKGGAHLQLSPLAVRLEDAALSGAAAGDDSLATAGAAVIPVTLGQLFGATPEVSSMRLTNAEFALLINERGEANWELGQAAATGPLQLSLEQARFRYFDARNDQSLVLSHVDGRLELKADGGVAFAGTAVINGRLVRIDGDLKSLARVNADGSPLELALSADDGQATFSGRLSSAQVLSLAGPISLSSQTPGPALRLIGLTVPESASLAGPLTIDGALDTAGRAYAIRNATVSLGAFNGAGDLAADLRKARPKLQANLSADTLWLDQAVPAAGAKNGDWGRLPLPFALLKTTDAEVNLAARKLVYGGYVTGEARVAVTVDNGKLTASAAAQLADGGTLNLTVTADAGAIPPGVGLNIEVNDTAVGPLLTALTGATALTGNGGFTADVTASGTTQEELLGMLKGKASLDVVNGRIAGADFTGLMLAAKQKILDGWAAAPGGTPFTSLIGEATIVDGIASFRGVKLEGPDVSFTMEGLVDLLRQGLAVSTTAVAHGQPLLPVAVIARGLWAAPRIYPDIPDILNHPDAGFARLQDGTASPAPAPEAPPDTTQGN